MVGPRPLVGPGNIMVGLGHIIVGSGPLFGVGLGPHSGGSKATGGVGPPDPQIKIVARFSDTKF